MLAKYVILLAFIPVFCYGEKLVQNDIIVTGNTVGGDITINGQAGDPQGGGFGFGDGDIFPDGSEDGVFEDGCSVIGEMVRECDGTERPITPVEKKRVNARLARMQRKKRNMKSRQRSANNKKPSANKPVANKPIASKPVASRPVANKPNANRSKQTNGKKITRHGKEEGDEDDNYSPCNTCVEATGAMMMI